MAQFDLVGDFQTARQNRNVLASQKQGLQAEATAAPVRNELAQIGLRGARRGEEQAVAGQAQAQKLQQVTLLNNVAKALAPLEGQDRINAAQLINQRLPQEMRLDDNDLTDNGLVQIEASSRAFMTKQPTNRSASQQALDVAKTQQAQAKTAQIKAQSTPAATDLDRQKFELQKQIEKRQSTKLSAGLENALLKSQDAVVQSNRSSTEFDILADQVEAAELGGGIATSTSETFKRLLGTQDDVTEFRRRFNSVRLSEGLKNLPPGPATDKDMAEAFKGVPPENAPATQIASFLRGAAKMARFDAGYNQFKSDFISEKSTAKGLNKEWRSSVHSNVLNRSVTIAEIYAEASLEGISPEEVKAELGIE